MRWCRARRARTPGRTPAPRRRIRATDIRRLPGRVLPGVCEASLRPPVLLLLALLLGLALLLLLVLARARGRVLGLVARSREAVRPGRGVRGRRRGRRLAPVALAR